MSKRAVETDPPLSVGQRVRCNVRTLDRGDRYQQIELFGRLG